MNGLSNLKERRNAAMDSRKLIEIVIENGYKVDEYPGHYCTRISGSVIIVVTIPKATNLAKTVVDAVKKILNII